MAKYQQRPVDVFVWDGVASSALKQFVLPHVVEVAGRVVSIPDVPGSEMLVPGDCIMKFASGQFTVCDGALFAAEYDPAVARHHPTHVVVDFGNGHKIDVDVANIYLPEGECLLVNCNENGPVAGSAKHDELECTNGA